MTHEIGHTYGNDHVEGTVMRRQLANQLIATVDQGSGHPLAEIDDDRELVTCDSCVINYQGTLGGSITSTTSEGTHTLDLNLENFETLVGLDPAGGSAAVKGVLMGNKSELVLEISDASATYAFALNLNLARLLSYSDGVDIFKAVRAADKDMVATASRLHSGSSLPGTLVTKTGQTLDISLNRNMNAYLKFPKEQFAMEGERVRAPVAIFYNRAGGTAVAFGKSSRIGKVKLRARQA